MTPAEAQTEEEDHKRVLILHSLGRNFQPFVDRVTVRSLYELSLDEMEEHVAALPANTAIIYGLLTLDRAGVVHERDEALDAIYAAASAPIFGLFDTEIGRGIVGGPLLSVSEASRCASEAALRILSDEEPESVVIDPVSMGAYVYDFRELQRWGIPESRLPPGRTVLYRPPPAWEQYRGPILTALAVMILQAALITGLLVQRSRRRVAAAPSSSPSRSSTASSRSERFMTA